MKSVAKQNKKTQLRGATSQQMKLQETPGEAGQNVGGMERQGDRPNLQREGRHTGETIEASRRPMTDTTKIWE